MKWVVVEWVVWDRGGSGMGDGFGLGYGLGGCGLLVLQPG